VILIDGAHAFANQLDLRHQRLRYDVEVTPSLLELAISVAEPALDLPEALIEVRD